MSAQPTCTLHSGAYYPAEPPDSWTRSYVEGHGQGYARGNMAHLLTAVSQRCAPDLEYRAWLCGARAGVREREHDDAHPVDV